MSRPVPTEERRARLGVRHRLAQPASDLVEVTRSVVALHSSDPSTVYMSLWARAREVTAEEISATLYEDRSLVRVYGMRRTLWVVDRETHPQVEHSSTIHIAPGERRRMVRMLEDGGVTEDGAGWLDDVSGRTERVIAKDGPMLARDLTKQVSGLTEKLTFYNKKGKLMGSVGVSTRTLVQLALESRIIRAAPVGTWISSQYRWSTMEQWLGGPIPEMDPHRARADLLRKWLSRFGPATVTDMKWWTGWTVGHVRAALGQIGAVPCTLDGADGYLHPDDAEPVTNPDPWVALLPSLDPTTMGWKQREWYIGDHGAALFDRSGNAGPTVWVNGRVVGGWAQRKTGEVVYELLENVGREAIDAIETRVSKLKDWLGDMVVTPRFRAPLDRTLTG